MATEQSHLCHLGKKIWKNMLKLSIVSRVTTLVFPNLTKYFCCLNVAQTSTENCKERENN